MVNSDERTLLLSAQEYAQRVNLARDALQEART